MLNRAGAFTIATALVVWSSAGLSQTGYSGAPAGGVVCGPGSAQGPCAMASNEQTASVEQTALIEEQAAVVSDEKSKHTLQWQNQLRTKRGNQPSYRTPGM